MNIEWNKVTWYSKFLALALFVALPFIGFYLGVKYGELTLRAQTPLVVTPSSGSCPTGIVQKAAPTPVSDADFSETGNLTSDANGNWYLLYGKAGAPALRVGLIVTDGSECIHGTTHVLCDAERSKWVTGARITVEGIQNGGVVTVVRMTL